jgi:ADP-heptose:LPS heptosyltransferase/tetratricopeptide (TPR) repeat protein
MKPLDHRPGTATTNHGTNNNTNNGVNNDDAEYPADDADDIVYAADQARLADDFFGAAKLYAAAAAMVPARTDFLMMQGHCLKDGGDHAAALEAYRQVAARAPSADVNVQLGHLFKISGNFSDAKHGYSLAAAQGEQSSISELESFAQLTPDALKFHQGARTSDGNEIPLETFWALFACDLNDNLDCQGLARAAKALAVNGQKDLAAAFQAVAFLSDESGRYRREHLAATQRLGSSRHSGLSQFAQNQAAMQNGRPIDSGRHLGLLAKAVLSPGYRGNEKPLALGDQIDLHNWPPAILTAAESEKLAPQLLSAIERTYQNFLAAGPRECGELIDAIRDLARDASSWANAVVFPQTRSLDQFRMVAVHILQNQVKRWLTQVESRYLGPYADPVVAGAFLASFNNPLIERFSELQSASKVFHEIDTLFAVLSPETPLYDFDVAFARLISVCLNGLAREEVLSLFIETKEHGYPVTSAILRARLLPSGPVPEELIVEIAQKIKASGDARLALDLLSERIEEEWASDKALIEKALTAKVAGEFAIAARLLELCAARDADNMFLRRELAMVLPEIEAIPGILSRFSGDALFMQAARERGPFINALNLVSAGLTKTVVADQYRAIDLAPEIAAEFMPSKNGDPESEEIRILEAGWRKGQGAEGPFVLLRALDFVRARISSRARITKMRARIDGKTIGTAVPSLLSAGGADVAVKTWVFNCWMDLSDIEPGRHELQLYFEEYGGGYRSIEKWVWVDPSANSAEETQSTAIVTLPENTRNLPLDERINALPSLILPAGRTLFEGPLQKILVMRADQLGDVATSLQAMFALKKHFPSAELYCAAAPSNLELLRSAGLFEQLFEVELTYDPGTRRRFASFEHQAVLKKQLSNIGFDLAIDLSPGSSTRPLLRLADARYTAGFGPSEFPWLSFALSLETRDPGNGRGASPHSMHPLTLVEALSRAVDHKGFHLPNTAIGHDFLKQRNLDGGRGFAVVHCGARTASRKWPAANFVALAHRIAREMHLRVVIIADSPMDFDGVDPDSLDTGEFEVISGRLTFSALDTLLSTCAVFIGNDSGPKHLAALRGTPVVSIHMGAVNWREWGQEDSGVIVTRRVPCYGCGIEDPAECGKGLPCLVNISVDEVFEGVARAMNDHKAHARDVRAAGPEAKA